MIRVARAATSLLAIAVALPAMAQDRLTVDVSAGAGVATNPFLQAGDTPTAFSGTIQVTPTYVIESALTRFQIRGDAALTEYTERYPTNDSYALDVSATHQFSPRTQLNARLGYLNAIVGGFNDLGVIGSEVLIPGVTPGLPTGPVEDPVGATDPVPIPGPILPGNVVTDPALGAIGSRRRSYQAGAGVQHQLGAQDRVYTDLNVIASRFGGGFDDYNYVGQRVGYSRTISADTAVSADLLVGRTDYRGSRAGDATFFQPSVGYGTLVAPGTRLNVSIGAAIVRIDGLTDRSTSTSLNGSASLCRNDERWNGCLSVNRATVPSGFGGIRTQNAAVVSAGYRLSERDSYTVSLSYSRVGGTIGDAEIPGAIDGSSEFVSARVGYNRRLSQRLSGFVTGGVGRAYDDQFLNRDANIEGRIGVRYRFGAER